MGIARTTQASGPPAGPPFSFAVTAAETCLISGMLALGDDGRYEAASFEEELARAWRHVVAIADAAGFTADEVVFVQCVLGDIGDYAALNAWRQKTFPGPAPARFAFQAGALPFGCKVELQAVAARG